MFSTVQSGLRLSTEQIELVKRIYPYDTWYYKDLERGLREVLKRYPHRSLGREDQVIARSQHDGRGNIWSIILINREDEYGPPDWVLAAHHGHHSDKPLSRGQIERDYVAPLQYRYLQARAAWYSRRNTLKRWFFRAAVLTFFVITLPLFLVLQPMTVLEEIGFFCIVGLVFFPTLKYVDSLKPSEEKVEEDLRAWEDGKRMVRFAIG